MVAVGQTVLAYARRSAQNIDPWGLISPFKVAQGHKNDTVRSSTCDFLLVICSNSWPISHRFRQKRQIQSKNAIFLHLYLTCNSVVAQDLRSNRSLTSSAPVLHAFGCNPGQVIHTRASVTSINWYRPKGGDALRLGRQPRSGVALTMRHTDKVVFHLRTHG